VQILSVTKYRRGDNNTHIQQMKLSESITNTCVDRLSELGNVTYHINYPNVFFRVKVNNDYLINGMINNRVLEIIYLNKDYKKCSEKLRKDLMNINYNYIKNEVS
jgi:hypothetical protein